MCRKEAIKTNNLDPILLAGLPQLRQANKIICFLEELCVYYQNLVNAT
jgi:hypothetical protein